MRRERMSASFVVELFELEQDAHRISVKLAERIGRGPPAAALRAVAGHANEALEELRAVARPRRIHLDPLVALLRDAVSRLRDALLGPLVEQEHAYRDTLTSLRRGVDLARLTSAAAIEEGDEALATWCQRWVRGREGLVDDVADQLTWFARRPALLRRSSLVAVR